MKSCADLESVNVVIAGVALTVWRSGAIIAHTHRGRPIAPRPLYADRSGKVKLAGPNDTNAKIDPARIVLCALSSVPLDAVGTVAFANGDHSDLSVGNLSLLCGASATASRRNGWRSDIFPPHLLALLAKPRPAANVPDAARMIRVSEERLARSLGDFVAANRPTKIAEYLSGYSMIGRSDDEPARPGSVTVATVDPSGLYPAPGEPLGCTTTLHTSAVPAVPVGFGGFAAAFGTRGGAERWIKMMVKSFAEIAAHLNSERAAAIAQFLRGQP